MTFDELVKITYEAGIVGAGGAGFPTHKKFSKNVSTIVVNGAECEPLMMVDHHLLKNHLKSLFTTLEILLDAMEAEEAIIGIKGKNMHLLDEKVVKAYCNSRIKIKEIPDIYPAGDEVVLVYETTGKIIPEGSLPLAVGVMVINAETLYNIYCAITKQTPVTDKYVKIGGDTKEDFTVKPPVGANVAEVLEKCGINLEGKAVIDGGPMMGRVIDPKTASITKTTKGLLVFPETHSVIQRKKMPLSVSLKRAAAACCSCNMCTDMCPRHLLGYSLEVHKTLRAASHSEIQNTESFLQNTLCCGCGVCSVIACQQMLNPQAIATSIKGALAKKGFKRTNNIAPEKVRDERQGRLVPSEKLIDRLGIRKYVKDKNERIYLDFGIKTVKILLSQHVGKPATPVVKKGDAVKKGMVIAKTDENALGAVIHASIDGRVEEVTETYIIIKA